MKKRKKRKKRRNDRRGFVLLNQRGKWVLVRCLMSKKRQQDQRDCPLMTLRVLHSFEMMIVMMTTTIEVEAERLKRKKKKRKCGIGMKRMQRMMVMETSERKALDEVLSHVLLVLRTSC